MFTTRLGKGLVPKEVEPALVELKGKEFICFRDKELLDEGEKEILLDKFNLLGSPVKEYGNYCVQVEGEFGKKDSTLLAFCKENEGDDSYYICSDIEYIQSGAVVFR